MAFCTFCYCQQMPWIKLNKNIYICHFLPQSYAAFCLNIADKSGYDERFKRRALSHITLFSSTWRAVLTHATLRHTPVTGRVLLPKRQPGSLWRNTAPSLPVEFSVICAAEWGALQLPQWRCSDWIRCPASTAPHPCGSPAPPCRAEWSHSGKESTQSEGRPSN